MRANIMRVLLVVSLLRPAAAQENLLERGRYLVETAAYCGICHMHGVLTGA